MKRYANINRTSRARNPISARRSGQTISERSRVKPAISPLRSKITNRSSLGRPTIREIPIRERVVERVVEKPVARPAVKRPVARPAVVRPTIRRSSLLEKRKLNEIDTRASKARLETIRLRRELSKQNEKLKENEWKQKRESFENQIKETYTKAGIPEDKIKDVKMLKSRVFEKYALPEEKKIQAAYNTLTQIEKEARQAKIPVAFSSNTKSSQKWGVVKGTASEKGIDEVEDVVAEAARNLGVPDEE